MIRIVLIMVFLSLYSWGHGLNVFALEENNTLHVKAYFSKSSPCQACDVEVYTLGDVLLVKDKTDDKGEISLPLLEQKVRIVVKASMGHQGTYLFTTNTVIENDYPLWLKLFLGVVIIITFFGGLKFARKAS